MWNPKVSICVPTFNRSPFLRVAIESIMAQTFRDYELIVVDNCSTDDTREVVTNLDNLRIRYVRNERNIGMTGNFNRCLELAHCEYVNIFHDDDVMLPNLLRREVEILETNSEAVIVHAAGQLIDESGRIFNVPPQSWPRATHGVDFISRYWRGEARSRIVMSSVMLRKTVAMALGGFNPHLSYSPDADLWQRMAFKGYVAFVDEVLVSDRIHRGEVTIEILSNRCQMVHERLKYAQATQRLVGEHGGNLDVIIGRGTSRRLATDLTQLRFMGASIAQVLRYSLAAIRFYPRILRNFLFFRNLVLAVFPPVVIGSLKKLRSRCWDWATAGAKGDIRIL